MNIHEYQAKQIFAEYGLPVPKGAAASTVDDAVTAVDIEDNIVIIFLIVQNPIFPPPSVFKGTTSKLVVAPEDRLLI